MKQLLFLINVVIFFCACQQPHKKVVDEETVLGMLYQQKAGEYEALCLQSYNLAKLRIDTIKAKPGEKLAIVTDLDETALDNSPGDAEAYDKNQPFDLKNWWLHGHPRAVPGAVDFFKYAAAKGFHIWYVSNRLDSLPVIEATRKAMNKLGFPYTDNTKDDSLFLFLPQGKNVPSTKQPRRDKIEKIYKQQIVLLLGDNLIDLDSTFDRQKNGNLLSSIDRQKAVLRLNAQWGNKYIVFPNAYYGDWEAAIYNNATYTLPQKQEFREKSLDTLNAYMDK
jgi:5'-nucleotidase (lipoprotein e(P4) family)